MVNSLLVLLAEGGQVTQQQMLRALRTGFRVEQSTHEAWAYVLVGAGIVGLLGIAFQIWRRSESQKENARSDLFRASLDMLRLRGDEKSLLELLRLRAGLAEPVAMLLTPANLAYALAKAGVVSTDNRNMAVAKDLCQRLFDRPLPPPPDSSGSGSMSDTTHFVRES